MVEMKAAFVPGANRRIPTSIFDGHPERIMWLTFDLQNDSGLVPTVVTRDLGVSGESLQVPQQAFLVGPRAMISRLSPGNATASPGSGSGDVCERPCSSSHIVLPQPIPTVDVAGISLPGYAPGYKDRNQDAALLLDTFLSNQQQLLAVFDGHGPEGHRVSAFVKRNLPYTLLAKLVEEDGAHSGCADTRPGGLFGARPSSDTTNAKQTLSISAASPSVRAAFAASPRGVFSDAGDGACNDGCAGGPLPRALWRTVTSLDQQLGDSGIDVINSGSTMALCHVHGRLLTAAWVGDSRMLLGLPARARTSASPDEARISSSATVVPRDGKLTATTAASESAGGLEPHRNSSGGGSAWRVAWSSTDHKPELSGEAMRIKAAGGRVARSVGRQGPVGPYRVWFQEQAYPGLAMSRALGDLPGRDIGITCTPSCASIRLPDNGPAVLVLASDGVWELLSNEQVLELATETGSANEAANRVVQQSRRAWVKEYGGSYVDDITAVVMRFGMRPQQRTTSG